MFPSALVQLIRKLRHANARHSNIALQHRARLNPTYHAKRRAYWAGLRIDVPKARDCPSRYISRKPLPVIDSSPLLEPPPFLVPSMDPAASTSSTHPLSPQIECIPEILVSPPTSHPAAHHGSTTRIPSPDLNWDYAQPDLMHDDSIPGAPLLKPMQLPDDDTHMIDAPLDESPSSFESSLGYPLTPIDVYGGLRIVIPPRNLKRKFTELECGHNDLDAHHQPHKVP